MHPTPRWLPALLLLVLATAACTLFGQPAAPAVPTAQVVTVIVTAAPSATALSSATPAPSATAAPAATDSPAVTATAGAAATPAPSATPGPQAVQAASPTPGPQCTVVKALNLRSGPGTAYYPVLTSFPAGTVLVPGGYNPVGNPGGAWVQVTNPADNQKGWVSAGAEFLNCNLDLTTLPAVAVQAPPPPQAPVVSNLPAQGPQGGSIDFAVVMSPDYLLRVSARQHGAAKDGDGIDHVLFTVSKDGKQVYQATEKTSKYCIFKGGEPDCNPWPKTGGKYAWGDGGPAIDSGDYQVTVRIALKSDPGNESQWTFQISIKLP